MKYITILFTRYRDFRSALLCYSCGQRYTHCSLALCEDPDTFYSFNIKGFAVESMDKFIKRGVKDFCSVRIAVTDSSYEMIKYQVNSFKERKDMLFYSKLGVVCALLHIPYKARNRYFCSEFVASILHSTNAVKLEKTPGLYLPYTLFSELVTTSAVCDYCFA